MQRVVVGFARQLALLAALWLAQGSGAARGQEERRLILPEQRHLEIRDPEHFHPLRIPDSPPPETVAHPLPRSAEVPLGLDDAIRTALANAQTIRVVTGTTVSPSGATIFDPAITNTTIDQQRARFDPTISSQNTFSRTETPQVVVNPGPPAQFGIVGTPINGFNSQDSISKTFITGGTLSASVNTTRTAIDGVPSPTAFSPATQTNTTIALTQPLLQGAGAQANLAPIIIARTNTERSFFVMKDATQDLVQGTIQAYWSLVFAQTDVWARTQQVDQGREAFERAEARQSRGLGNDADTAQARVAYEQFRAQLIASQGNLLTQEALLRNIMGISPSDLRRIKPVTPPTTARLKPDWNELQTTASQYRPNIIELKLVLEADTQQLLISKNNALPNLSVNALYRWNGLDGRTPDGTSVNSGDQFADWQMGVNFSVPLGLRQGRAQLRQAELVIARDHSNLDEALLRASHNLAGNLRNLDQFYEQFLAFGRTREAAYINLERQLADYRLGRRTLYINVLQAITDWGNAVSSENQSLTQYNTELARLQREAGTILEAHGVRFIEERYRSIGPLGRLADPVKYPLDMRPGPNADCPLPVGVKPYTQPEAIPLPSVEPLPPVDQPPREVKPKEELPPPVRMGIPRPPQPALPASELRLLPPVTDGR